MLRNRMWHDRFRRWILRSLAFSSPARGPVCFGSRPHGTVTRSTSISRPIARRVLEDRASHAHVEVVLGRPRKEEAQRRWVGPYQLKGLYPEVFTGGGIDSFQSVYNALEGIRVRLRRTGRHFAIPGSEPPYLGFPMFVTEVLGLDVDAELEELVTKRGEPIAKRLEEDYIAKYGVPKAMPTRRKKKGRTTTKRRTRK